MSATLPRQSQRSPYRLVTSNLTGFELETRQASRSSAEWADLHADVYPYGLLPDGVQVSRTGYGASRVELDDTTWLDDARTSTVQATSLLHVLTIGDSFAMRTSLPGNQAVVCEWHPRLAEPVSASWTASLGWSYAHQVDSARRVQMIAAALNELVELVARGEAKPSPAAVNTTWRLLQRFTTVGAPTPQVGATASASIELVWLRRGLMVSFVIDRDGSFIVWSQDADGVDRFEFEAESVEALSGETVSAIEFALSEMADSAIGPA